MDGNEAQLATIKDAIKKGELTKEIIERRLNAAIDAELRKTDSPADMELINACQDLLWEINMHGEPYHSNQQQSLAALREKLAKMERAKKRKRRVLGIAMASFLLVVGSFAVDTALHRQWLEGEQAPDEQQYIISGQENNPGLLTESQAGNEPIPYPQSITTTSLEEVVSILGYTPLMPTWLPEGWTIESYYIRMGDTSVIRIMCQNEQEEELLRLSRVRSARPQKNQAIADNRSIEQRICIKPAKRSRQRDLSLLVRFMQRRATPITQKDVSRR